MAHSKSFTADHERRVIELIREAQGQEVMAQLRIGLTTDRVVATAPAALRNAQGRFETGLRAVIGALREMKPYPRSKGPPRHILYFPGPEGARVRLQVLGPQLRAAAAHLERADALYIEAVRLSLPLLTRRRVQQLQGDAMDAYQDGALYLHTAARRFDPDLGKPWKRYAIGWLMSCSRDRGVERFKGAITSTLYELRGKAIRAMGEALAAGYTPSISELAAQLGKPSEQVLEALEATPPASLDAPVCDDSTGRTPRSLGETLDDAVATATMLEMEHQHDVEQLLAHMDAEAAYVVARHFGLWGSESVPLKLLSTEPLRDGVQAHLLLARGLAQARGGAKARWPLGIAAPTLRQLVLNEGVPPEDATPADLRRLKRLQARIFDPPVIERPATPQAADRPPAADRPQGLGHTPDPALRASA